MHAIVGIAILAPLAGYINDAKYSLHQEHWKFIGKLMGNSN
jgi:hypothetical protein